MRIRELLGMMMAGAVAYHLTSGIVVADSPSSGWINVREAGASGSQFETRAATTAGSSQVTLQDAGDFQVGQEVTVSRSNIQYRNALLWGPTGPYGTQKPLKDAVEIRGYDGSTSSWLVYILEVQTANPPTFRWSDDLVHGNKWKALKVPITGEWQKLSNGIEVKFGKQDWQPGHMITWSARDQLASVIEKIEGKVLTLRDQANRTAADAVVRHSDRSVIQAAIDRAIRQKQNVFFPEGHYRVPGGLVVKNAAIRVEGSSGVHSTLDTSDGNGVCFDLDGGEEVTIRNFRMIGHTGLADRPGEFRMSHGQGSFWASAVKSCQAVRIKATERVLVENVHASRMSSECFYSQGPGRAGVHEPKQYTKNLTFLRCTVTDCCANAFNNNDDAENTSVLYCRVDGVGWQAYEGPGRFIKIIGNYFRNSSNGVWVGSMNSRADDLVDLGCGQAIIADNVFEGIGRNYRGVLVERGATQVVVANNLFVNYGNNFPAGSFDTRAIEVSGVTDPGLPTRRVTVTGNIIDLTSVGVKSQPRTGIKVNASDTIVCDNQIYVRGACDPQVTGISLSEPALEVNIHNNLIRNCGFGLKTGRSRSRVTEVIDPMTFLCRGMAHEARGSHLYRDWNVAWLGGAHAGKVSLLDSFDPKTLRFRLKERCELKVGDTFDAFSSSANWNLHDNTIIGCLKPLVLDSYGSETSWVKNNVITRGEATGVKVAVEIRGVFHLIGNQISGFDEKDSSALSLVTDPLGRMTRNLYRDNIFQHCTAVLPPEQKGLKGVVESGSNVVVPAAP